MTDNRQLRCPACDGPMQQVDRRGVLIDLCRDCRGVFLDRGELDKLLEEAAAQQQPTSADATAPPSAAGTAPPPPGGLADEADRLAGRGDDLRYDDRDRRYRDGDDDDDYSRGGRSGRRRRGWLDDVFDFD